MKNVDLQPDPNATQSEPIPLTELDKVKALGLLMEELRNIRIAEVGNPDCRFPPQNVSNYFWHLMGFTEGLIDRMAKESTLDDAFYSNWHTYVADKIAAYQKAYKISYKNA